MKIFGIGTDIVNIKRLEKILKKKNNNFKTRNHNTFKNGFLLLKGGGLKKELSGIKHIKYDISDYFNEDYFLEKKIIYIPK